MQQLYDSVPQPMYVKWELFAAAPIQSEHRNKKQPFKSGKSQLTVGG